MNNDMFGKCGMRQFVGVGVCDTIGLYIANIDDDLRKQMNIPETETIFFPIQIRTVETAVIPNRLVSFITDIS